MDNTSQTIDKQEEYISMLQQMLENYNEALKKLEEVENILLTAKTYLLLADYYLKTGKANPCPYYRT